MGSSAMITASKNISSAINFVLEHHAQFIDLRFTDLFGSWQHLTIPASRLDEKFFAEGLGFDGSSIRGFQAINESDMLLVPDPSTIFMDPFCQHSTAAIICNIIDPVNLSSYNKDSRFIAQKAEKYLESTNIADTAFFGPEAEFFLLDKLRYQCYPQHTFYEVDSEEAYWNTGKASFSGIGMRPKEGYLPCAPSDRLQDVRSEIADKLMDMGTEVELHHHEVAGAGQCEIDLRYDKLVKMADNIQKYKYAVRNTAIGYGLTATFMPKPIFGDNGNGMHLHMSLWKGGINLFSDDNGYAGISEQAQWFIGGILKHAPALLAFCAPTTNSYRRLVPGYEAPINLVYSMRNRSACIRIPIYGKTAASKRIEFRAPDPAANPYLAFAACLMAGIDGIQNKIQPREPLDKNFYELSPREKQNIPQTPTSLRETLLALQNDYAFLTNGGVFTQDIIDTYINYKLLNECDALDLRPHPYEFYLYADA